MAVVVVGIGLILNWKASISQSNTSFQTQWISLVLSEVHGVCKLRNPIPSCSTLPEQTCNPSGPYLPLSDTGISLSCSHAKHHSSSPPTSLSVIKCKVPAAVVKWRDDVKTGALVNTDSVLELCCFLSRPVHLFQSINQDSGSLWPYSAFILLLVPIKGLFLAIRGCRDIKQAQTKWEAH